MDLVAKVVKYEGFFFYVARNDDTPGAVAEFLGDKIDATDFVRLNKKRFPGISKNARLMARTCLAIPPGFDDAADDATAGIRLESFDGAV